MRYEVTIPKAEDLPEIIQILKDKEIKHIHIPNKTSSKEKIEYCNEIQSQLPGISITLHVPAGEHTEESFKDYVEEALQVGVSSFLIISGEERKDFETLKALEVLQDTEAEYLVVYNPFYSGETLEIENVRLMHKLAYNHVDGVVLQIGLDEATLLQAVELIEGRDSSLEIYGAVLIPNHQILKKIQDDAWNGVLLDEEYLSNSEFAEAKTRTLLTLYKELGIEPIVIIKPFTQNNVEEFHEKY